MHPGMERVAELIAKKAGSAPMKRDMKKKKKHLFLKKDK